MFVKVLAGDVVVNIHISGQPRLVSVWQAELRGESKLFVWFYRLNTNYASFTNYYNSI